MSVRIVENPAQLSRILRQEWDNRNGPEGASTPESPGLTRITRLNRGARL